VTGLFLGYYLPWDSLLNAEVAQAHGFRPYPGPIEGGLVGFEKIDNAQHGIHDYFKFLKFGFGRCTDQACVFIRRGRLTRAEGLRIVRERDGKFPWSYLGEPLERILGKIDLDLEEFQRICDRFTNRKLFVKDASGDLLRDARGNLTKVNYDNG
jgi:hypothetical protein